MKQNHEEHKEQHHHNHEACGCGHDHEHEACGCGHDHEPVSYTHLDVYKRQIIMNTVSYLMVSIRR